MKDESPSRMAIARSRTRFAKELENPEIKQKFAALIKAEVGSTIYGPKGRQAFIETVMNRAMIQGVSLQATIENRVTGDGKVLNRPLSKGYYQPLNAGGSLRTGKIKLSQDDVKEFDDLIKDTLAGSNLTNGGTHNASGSWGHKHIQDVKGSNVKNFSTVPGKDGELIYNKPGEQSKVQEIWKSAETATDKEELSSNKTETSDTREQEVERIKHSDDDIKKISERENIPVERVREILLQSVDPDVERLAVLTNQNTPEQMERIRKDFELAFSTSPKIPQNKDEANKVIGDAALGKIDPRSKAVDASAKILGLHESKDRIQIQDFLATGGKASNIDPKQLPWCGAFVNASLQQAGLKHLGAKGLIATNYLTWGTQKKATETQKGDIVIIPRGREAGQTGGHVGIATGETKVENGKLFIKVRGGNQRNGTLASEDWYEASRTSIRRATEKEFSDDLKEAIKKGQVDPDYLKSVGYDISKNVTKEAAQEKKQEIEGSVAKLSRDQQTKYEDYMAMRQTGTMTDEERKQVETQAIEFATDTPPANTMMADTTPVSSTAPADMSSDGPLVPSITPMSPTATNVPEQSVLPSEPPSSTNPDLSEMNAFMPQSAAPAATSAVASAPEPAPSAVAPAPAAPSDNFRAAQEAGIVPPPPVTRAGTGSVRAAEEESMSNYRTAQTEQRIRSEGQETRPTASASTGGDASAGAGTPSQNNTDYSPPSPGSTGQSQSDESLCWV